MLIVDHEYFLTAADAFWSQLFPLRLSADGLQPLCSSHMWRSTNFDFITARTKTHSNEKRLIPAIYSILPSNCGATGRSD